MRTRADAIAGAQVVARTVQLLKLVSERTGGGLLIAELVCKSGLTRPTVYRLLSALEATGFIEQDRATRRWHLGMESFVLGTLAASRFNIERLARESVVRIADHTGESTFLSVCRGMDSVCLIREEGTYPIRTHVLQAGDRLPLGVGSAGLAMLAAMPDELMSEMIEANRERIKAKYSNYSPELLRQLVAETRHLGYAVNRGLILMGSWGLAAAVRDANGWPVCAISITGIESRLKAPREAELSRLLIRESLRLSDLLRSNQTPAGGKRRVA
jgi:DNA-binding IclR family transcriptional regulator